MKGKVKGTGCPLHVLMERDEEKQSDTEQKELPPTFNFTQKALKKVELVAKECKYAKVVDNLEGTFTNAIEEARKGNRNAAWPPLQLCLGSNSSKLLIVTLDTITKMCAHGIFQDGCYDDPPPVTGPPAEQRNSFTEGEESPPASQVSQTFAEDIVTTMCSCKTEDEAVRLQLIRVTYLYFAAVSATFPALFLFLRLWKILISAAVLCR